MSRDPTSPSTSVTQAGSLLAIWIKRARRGPMDSVESVVLEAQQGLEGNANRGGKRQVTLLDEARWSDVEDELGHAIDPRTRRANLFLRGIDLEASRGKILQIGDCRIEILGETRPCRLMDDSVPGLQRALDPHWRAGAYGQVLDDGRISLGAAVRWLEPSESS